MSADPLGGLDNVQKLATLFLATLFLSCASQRADQKYERDVPLQPFPVSAEVERFYRWFEDPDQAARPEIRETNVRFLDLKRHAAAVPAMPRRPFEIETLVLWESDSSGVVLAVSKRHETPGGAWECQRDFASIVVMPGGTWSTIDLVPHCSPVYGEDEIDFTLYWLPDDTLPHIAITANHPACVPIDLYSFDADRNGYRRVRHKCTD